MSEDKLLHLSYAMAASLLQTAVDTGEVEKMCEAENYSQDITQALKHSVGEHIKYLSALSNHYARFK